MKASKTSDTWSGQRIYTPLVLKVYDLWVLGISNSFIWKCPTSNILEFYNENVSANHLDVGVGTGYFLNRCRFPEKDPRIVLADLNPNSLAATAKRIKRYSPETYEADVLKDFSIPGPKFDSIGINYLLHCLPGSMESKSQIFSNLRAHLNPSGVVFGSTILYSGLNTSRTAHKLMDIYNSKKIFSNTKDSLANLEMSLREHFETVSIRNSGTVALFSAKGPRLTH